MNMSRKEVDSGRQNKGWSDEGGKVGEEGREGYLEYFFDWAISRSFTPQFLSSNDLFDTTFCD